MVDIAIVGGGLSGMALANGLQVAGEDFAIFEGRTRLGGRIQSTASDVAAMMVDLGATWYWPATQPRITRLLRDLKIDSFPQHDSGEVLGLTHPDKTPGTVTRDPVHGGAHRIDGGANRLVAALSERIPADRVFLGCNLIRLSDSRDHVELEFREGEVQRVVYARQVVLAVPPRLLAEHVTFEPELDPSLIEAMRNTPTWMAGSAKLIVGYANAFWRERGLAGNAFSNHEQAALGEIYDACGREARHAALGGFVALPAGLREVFRVGLPMLMCSQLVQFFGDDAEHGEMHFTDWACEPMTCSTLDREPLLMHPEYGNRLLIQPWWAQRLWFCGSETAGDSGGYMEGALESAGRVQRGLRFAKAGSDVPQLRRNADCLERFSSWVELQRSVSIDRYREAVARTLAGQTNLAITQHAMLHSVAAIYRDALAELGSLHFDAESAAVEKGRSALTPLVLAPFHGLSESLMDRAFEYNRSSCALSNFPHETNPDRDYLVAIRLDLAAAWREFALGANALLLGKRRSGSLLEPETTA